MLYSDWVTQVVEIFQIMNVTSPSFVPASAAPTTSPDFNNIIPAAITYTEQRIQRELDLLGTVVTDSTGMLTANQKSFTLPTSNSIVFQVVQQVIPVVSGVRQKPMLPVSRDYLEASWPIETAASTPSVPTMWCPVDQTSILVAPPPDTTYSVLVTGTKRVAPLSATNTSNFLTLVVPDLYTACSCIFLCGYQRDFGAQSSDPQQALSWENIYNGLLKSAVTEEFRKKVQSAGWSTRQPNPVASPPQN